MTERRAGIEGAKEHAHAALPALRARRSDLRRLPRHLPPGSDRGAGPWRRLAQIDLPIAAPSLAAAALILFVEILKELPATLILRPFDFDTLAVKAYSYASDERLLEAAAPSLLIFVAGLAPILVLSRGIMNARAGAR